jgi:nucleoside-diphosphate-sugar epimerase
MRVLVTGACGFIGAWVVRKLKALGVPMVLTDVRRDPTRLSVLVPDWEDVPFVADDLTRPEFLPAVIEREGIDRIIHLAAWQIPLCRQDPIGGAMVNVVGTLRVFEWARQFQGQIRRIVYASSAAVFGPPEMYPQKPVPEEVVLKPATHYGAFKVCNELCANAYWQEWGIASAGLRPSYRLRLRARCGRDSGHHDSVEGARFAPTLPHPLRRLDRLAICRRCGGCLRPLRPRRFGWGACLQFAGSAHDRRRLRAG